MQMFSIENHFANKKASMKYTENLFSAISGTFS